MDHRAQPSSPASDLAEPDLYLNRELSWIAFNRRVFHEAQDSRHPLLERVKFVSIFETNLDEFIMIRLAGLKDQVESYTQARSPDGRTAEEQLVAVRQQLALLVQEVRQYWRHELLPLLADQHIHILDFEQLNEWQRSAMQDYFEHEVFPVLTPLAIDAVHPFPHISNRSLNLAVVISDLAGECFARVKIPPSLPRLVRIASAEAEKLVFVWLEQLIAANLHMLFPGFEVWEAYPFRVLRDADIELQDDDAADLLEYIEQEVRERRFGTVVDLTVIPAMPSHIRSLLLDNLEISSDDLTIIDGPLGLDAVIELYKLECPDLKNKLFTPRVPAYLCKYEDLFAAIKKQDILLHHPYDSFSLVIDFIRTAASDPQVLTIKQTLYRVGPKARVVQALLEAVENGKQVAVLVELKARFDEENNIVWARELERAGVHVVYSLKGLKTHAKLALVVRKEEHGLQRYAHFGTGNYNATTARTYEDLCLLTCQSAICADATMLFNALTGYSRQSIYSRLLIAPMGLRHGVTERIEREICQHQQYGNGRLIFKMNALTDPWMINLLYRASQVGVSIDLIVRGMCCLCPGVPGVSDTIRVCSIVGRFLEHSRIYYFRNNGDEEIFLGSADLMQRNLDRRVELLLPLQAPELRQTIRERLLKVLLADTVNAHQLQPDGTYRHIRSQPDQQPFDSQAWFMTHPLFAIGEEGIYK
jgi:polyphosphate kinase